MPYFTYLAKNQFGESIKGKVEAQSISLAATELSRRNLLVISITPLAGGSFVALQNFLYGVKTGDIVNFTRQLATMITAGLPLATGLSILVRQSKQSMTELVSALLQDIEGGATFSGALSSKQNIFSRIYVQLVKAGETGGVLDNVLERLADNLEKEREFRSKTKGALIYPVIVVIAMLIVGFVMMVWVVPKMTEMYNDFGAELPLATKILIAVSSFFSTFWWLILIAVGFGIVALRNWQKTTKGEQAVDTLLLRLPIIGDLRTKIVLTEFSRTLALLLGAGISLLEALDIVTEGVNSITYREMLAQVKKKVEKGIAMSQALSHHEQFPPILHQMIKVGEETGRLDEVLHKVSQYFEQETQQAVKNMTTAIEPMIMIVLGIGVGVMVMAIIMPIYNLTAQF